MVPSWPAISKTFIRLVGAASRPEQRGLSKKQSAAADSNAGVVRPNASAFAQLQKASWKKRASTDKRPYSARGSSPLDARRATTTPDLHVRYAETNYEICAASSLLEVEVKLVIFAFFDLCS
jgi:cytochrome oxidase assembly protein ShyY1